MRYGPFHTVAHCTFCGTSDVYVFPAPRSENEAYWERAKIDPPADAMHFEDTPTFCAECCGIQEDGHEYYHEPGEGMVCKFCAQPAPDDWYPD